MRSLSLALILAAAGLPALAQQAAPSAAALHLRMLSWPGKVQAPAPRQGPPSAAPMTDYLATAAQVRADPAWRPAYRPLPHGATHLLGDVTPAQAVAINAQRSAAAEEAEKAMAIAEARRQAQAQRQAEVQAAPPPAPALPTSIYAAPSPAQGQAQAPEPAGASRMAMAQPYDQKAHYYSLHRSYGQRPDPIALSPQFLSTPSADLADPPPPPPPRLLPGSNATAAQQTAARVQARDDSGD